MKRVKTDEYIAQTGMRTFVFFVILAGIGAGVIGFDSASIMQKILIAIVVTVAGIFLGWMINMSGKADQEYEEHKAAVHKANRELISAMRDDAKSQQPIVEPKAKPVATIREPRQLWPGEADYLAEQAVKIREDSERHSHWIQRRNERLLAKSQMALEEFEEKQKKQKGAHDRKEC